LQDAPENWQRLVFGRFDGQGHFKGVRMQTMVLMGWPAANVAAMMRRPIHETKN
jgi:hypothetical protein